MQKGFAHPLLISIILILMLLGGLGVYSLTTLLSSPTQNTPTSSLREASPATPNISAFKDYSNQPLGFSFRYAKDLVVSIDSEEEFNKRGNGNFRKNFTGYVGYKPAKVTGAVAVLDQNSSFDKSPFTVWVFENLDKIEPSAWFERYWFYPYLWGVFSEPDKGHVRPEKEATISGQTVKYSVVSYQPGSPKFILISQNQQIYLFRVIGDEGEKILQSFKFLESK